MADAFQRVGVIRERLGQFQDAETAYDRSRELFAGLVADFPSGPTYRHRLAGAFSSLGNLYGQTGRTSEAESFLVHSVTIHRQLATDDAGAHTYRYHLARDLNDLAILLKDLDRIPDAEDPTVRPWPSTSNWSPNSPTSRQFRDALALAHTNLGNTLDYARRLREAEESHVLAEAIYKETCCRHSDRTSVSRSARYQPQQPG